MNKDILRYSGAAKRDPAIDVWLDKQAKDLGVIARRWFGLIRNCGDDVVELMHDGCPVACIADAPFAYVNVFTAHVNVGFFQGSTLPDPDRLLLGTGKRMRHVKIIPGSEPAPDQLAALIDHAYRDIKEKLRSG